MAKTSGLAWTTLTVGDAGGTDRDLRGDITGMDVTLPRETQDVTGLDRSAMERLLLLADFSGSFEGVFNPASNQAHDVFKTVTSTSVLRTITLTVAGATLANECYLTDYAITRDSSGALTFNVPFSLGDGTVPTWT